MQLARVPLNCIQVGLWFIIPLLACGAESSLRSAPAPWHHPLYLHNDGYWAKRVALHIENESDQPANGQRAEAMLPALAGTKVESLRLCRADGVELLFDVRDSNGQPKRTGSLAAEDRVIFPVSCGANASATIYAYADNDDAWAVPDFLSATMTNASNAKLKVSPGPVEQLHLQRDAAKIHFSPEWQNHVEVRARNFSDEAASSLVRVDLQPALVRLPTISPRARMQVLSGSGLEQTFYRLGRGTELLIPADLPPHSERLFHVCFGTNQAQNTDTSSDYAKLLTSKSNLATNGDFEDGADSPAPWDKPPAGGVHNVQPGFSSEARFGKRCLELKVAENAKGDWIGWRSPEIPVQPGARYLLSGWLKALGLKSSSGIHAHFHNPAGALTKSGAMGGTQPGVSGDTDWINSVAFLDAPPDAASIQIHLTMNTQGVLQHDGLLLCRVTDGAIIGVHTTAGDVPRHELHVWEVNPLVKVFPETAPQPQAAGVTLELAQNEYEPFQLALRGRFGSGLAGVQISVSALTNEAGTALPPVKIERVGFVPIDYPSSYYTTEVPDWCRKVPRGAPRTDGWAGWWPDPLIPGSTFDIPTNQTTPVWFTLHTPKENTPPGVYRGRIEIKANTMKTITLPLTIRVLPFVLPDKTHLCAIFDFRFGPGRGFGSGADTPAARKQWLRFLAEHRLGIDAIQPAPKFTYENGQVKMDAAAFDEEAHFCLDVLGMNVTYTPHFFYMFGWAYPPKKLFGLEPFTPEWNSAFKQCYRLFTEHLREKGWHDKFVYYISDEPHFEHPFIVEQMKKLCALIHEVDASIPIFSSTWRHCPAWDDSLDLWGVGQHGSFPVSEMERLQKAGKQMWFTCDGQMATDTPYLATERMLPYYCHKYGVKGFEFWGVAWWTYDPWKTGWHQYIRQSDEGKKYYWIRYPNGDGFLAYPGKAVGVAGPVSTIRLEQVREGLEDYEAMLILAESVRKAKQQNRSTDKAEAALKMARDLVSIPNAGGVRSTDILPDPAQIPAIRKAVNRAMVQLLSDGMPAASALPDSRPVVRHVTKGEEWQMIDGRFHRNGEWVFIKTGKLLRAFAQPKTADKVIADIDVMIDRLNFNNFSLNIYPDAFDIDGDGAIDPNRREAYENIGRILDHCWKRGVFYSLSFETYNIGGGGTPVSFFRKHPEAVAINASGEKACDREYSVSDGKLTPSVFHPAYLDWSRSFIRNFLTGLGIERCLRLLFVETTVEPQYPGANRSGDKDPRRAFVDFNEAAREAFNVWQKSFPEGDPHRTQLVWPTTVEDRGKLLGNRLFNDFRAWGLAKWVSEDAEAIRSVARDVYIAVDYNGRFDDRHSLRVGTREVFLTELKGIDIIQIAPHPPVWTTMSWDDVITVNRKAGKRWAISEHMSATGSWGQDDREMTGILENTLARGTRFGWDLVNAGNRHATDDYHLYDEQWHSKTLDIIDGDNWPKWLKKIGVKAFVPKPR